MVDSWGYGVGWGQGTQILGGSTHKEPKFWLDPSMGLWIGVEVMVEEPKFWVDPTRFLGQMLGWWCGVEVRNPNSTPSSIPIWSNPNFG